MTDLLDLPPLPDGFTLDEPSVDIDEDMQDDASPVASTAVATVPARDPVKLPPLPEGFALDPAPADAIAAKVPEPVAVDKTITDPKQVEDMAAAQGLGVLEGAKNLAKGIGERFVQLEGGAVRGMATALPGSDPVSDFIYWATGTEKPANYPTPEAVTKTGQEVAKQMENVDLGFEEGDSWEDVKKAPASKFLPWAFKQGLLSAPDMALAMASLPGYAAIRSGELAQDRAQNDQRTDATVDDMLKAAPAAVVSGLLDRIGGRAMFGLDDVAVQGLKQVPKEAAKATVKEGITEGLQEGVESVATTAGTEKGFDASQTGEQMIAGALAGGVTGGAVRTGTGTIEAATSTDTPVEGDQSATVETAVLPSEAPVTRDGGGEVDSPLASSSSSITPEDRAILRRTSMPDEDIDAMSNEERAAKVAEARAAGIRVNGAMVRQAEQYRAPQPEPAPENIPIPEDRPVEQPVEQPVDAKAASRKLIENYQARKARDQQMDAEAEQRVQSVSPQLSAAVLRSVYEGSPQAPLPRPDTPVDTRPDAKAIAARQIAQYQARKADVDQAVSQVQPELESAVRASVAEDMDQEARVDRALGAPLAVQVQRSLYEDTRGDGSRLAPKRVELPEHIDAVVDRVNTEPSEAQKLAGNYAKSHIKVGGLDIAIENPKGSTRTGTSPDGLQWSVNMPAHYGYVKKSSGADGDQVDVYVGDNPASKRVYVVDQRDPTTRKFDEHKAVMGVNSISEARDLYARAFSDRSGFDRLGAITPMSISEFKAWLREGDTTKPVRMGKSVRLNEGGFPIDAKGTVKKPDSLIEFLARKGGVREDRGELATLGLRDRKSGFVTGAGPLIRPKGMHPDKAREAAAEAGYLPMESSLGDFYDAIDADARSGRQQFSQYDDDWSEAWRAGQGIEQRSADEDRAVSTEEEVRQQLAAYGFPIDGSERFVSAIARSMDTGLPFEEAVESAYIELAQEARDIVPPETPDIPFFGDDLEVQPGTTPEGSEEVRATGEQVARAEEGPTEGTGEDRPVRGEGGTEAESDGSREDGGRSDREGESQRPRVSPPETVYHGTSSGGFDSFDTYGGEYGLFGSGGYFTEDPNIALEYTRKGRGDNPTVYQAKLDLKDALDMDAPADKAKWQEAFGDYLDEQDIRLSTTNQDFYRAVEEFLSGEMIPRWEGSEIMQDGIRSMGHDAITHIGGGRHKLSKGTKHRVWIVFDPEQVTNFRPREANTETGADNRPQLVIPGAERATDADIAQRRADAPLKPKAPQKDPGGLFSDDVNEPQLFDQPASEKPVRTYKSESGKKRDMDLLTEVVQRVAGVDPRFADTLNLSKEGSKLWGRGDVAKARGQYNATDDVITLALDLMNWDAANHEAFHRLQNKFLTDRERAALKADERRLRQFLIDNGEKQANVDKMARIEVEAEAFAKWVAKEDQPAKVNTLVRRAWDRLAKMLRQVRNLLTGKGFKTYEDIFGEAKEGKIKERQPREKGALAKPEDAVLYSIVDRAPSEPIKAPAKPKNRFSDRLANVSKALAAKAKSKGGKFDRITEGDEETFGDFATRKVLDYLDPVLKMQQKVGVDLNDLSDAYLTARLAEGTIRHELHQVDEKYVQPAIKELAQVGATEKDLHEYLYAMHAPERNRVVGLRNEEGSDIYKAATDPSIRGASGMSTNEAKDLLRELAKDREKFMGIRRAASHIRAMLDDGLKRQLKAGLINKATYDELTQQWQHYVPLRAESDTEGTGGGMPSKSRGFDVRGDEFKGATGRYTKADNVVNYAVNNTEQSIIRAEKNKAATAALRFINQFDPQGESIAKVYWSEDPEKLGDITKAPPVYKRVIGKDGKVTNQRVNAFQMKDDVLAAKVGGKTYYMQFADPKVGLALKKMTFGELGATMRMLKTVSNWQSLINTRANPAFILINFLRDVQTGATIAMSKDFKAGEIAKMVGSIPSAGGALWRDARGKPGNGKWDKVVADFKANGGKISFDQYNTIEETAKKIQKDLAKASSQGVAGKTWRGFIELVENLNDTIENGIRVTIYNAAIEQGKTPKRAAFLARDLTVDFQKKGEITPHMNSLYTFFNASVQGNTNFAKALYRSRKVKVAMGALVMAGYAQHVINMALAGDDDDGENAYLKMLRNEPWTFERNIVLFLPGSKDYIKLPLGFGMNAFWHFGTQAGAVTTGDKDFLPAALDSTRVAFDAFNPLGSGGWISMALPSVIDPIWELGTNQNFSGNPIYPQENQFDPAPPPKSEQSFKSTSPVARWGAETLNKISGGSDKLPGAIDVYPDSLEYLWGWFTGGVGRFASQTVETAQRGVDLDFEPKKTPFIRSFYGAVDDQGKRSEYFAQREKVQYVKGKLKEFKEAGDEDGMKNFMADHEQEKKAISAFDTVEKKRRELNKQRRKLEKREGSADELKKLDEIELDYMNKARKAFFEAGKE